MKISIPLILSLLFFSSVGVFAETAVVQSATSVQAATACISATPCVQKTAIPAQPIENLTITTQGAATIIINSNVNLTESNLTTTQTVSPGAKPGAKPGGPSGKAPDKKKEKQPYAELIKDATKQEGLFTVFIKKDAKEEKILWEINPDQFGTDYLLSAKVGQGVGTLFPGAVLGSKVLNMRRVDDKIQIIENQLRYQADPDSPIRKGVERAYGESIIASFPLAATNPKTKACVIDVRPFLLSDFSGVGKRLGSGFGIDKGNSLIQKTKVFPNNIEIYAKQHFKSGSPSDNKALADPSSARVLLRLSFRILPKSDFRSRVADDRVGFFIEAHQDFSDLESKDRYVRHITRWNIEKASPEAAISPPKQPLVFWIENSVPQQYRGAVKNGVEMWNKAFEAAGFKNAVVAKQMPDDADWDPEDSRYNMIHWDTVEGLPFAGLAQWVGNPLTGEILDCDVIIDGEVVRYLRRLRRFVEPIQQLPDGSSPHRCQYAQLLAQETQLTLAVLAARKEIEDNTETVETFIKEYLSEVVCHEVGHVLGLRHNFKASNMLDLDELHDKKITAEKGLSSSVMDYLPLNIAPRGKPQGHYWSPSVGPYDIWAIQYAYTPLSATEETQQSKELETILSRCKESELAYLTDEDLWVSNPSRRLGLDPTNAWFDLSSDNIAWGEQQMDIMRDAWKSASAILKEGESYYDLRSAFGMFLGYYARYAHDMSRYIGGAYMVRSHSGSADGRPPMKNVPASIQREVMKALSERVFSDEPFQFDPSMLNMLISEKWYHWGVDWGKFGRTDFPLHDVILQIRRNVLNTLFDPLVLSRVRESEQKIASGEEAYTIPDIFSDLTDAIWGDVHKIVVDDRLPAGTYSNTAPFISSHRRALQREYVKMLVDLMLKKRGETPEDARTHAWNALADMKKDIEAILAQERLTDRLDQYSLVHLKETAATIERALDARLEIRMG